VLQQLHCLPLLHCLLPLPLLVLLQHLLLQCLLSLPLLVLF
jgi:hypothetical protein